jgi:hypothetical protein
MRVATLDKRVLIGGAREWRGETTCACAEAKRAEIEIEIVL